MLYCWKGKMITATETQFKWMQVRFQNIFKTVVVQLLSCVWLFVASWIEALQASLSFTISWSLFKFMSIESVMPSNHLILCNPFLLRPSIFTSIKVSSKSRLFASGGQSIGASASALVLPVIIQDWFPLGLTGWISLLSKGLSSLLHLYTSKSQTHTTTVYKIAKQQECSV